MGLSPWTRGDRQPPWVADLEPDSGYFDITGLTTADFTLEMFDIGHGGTKRTGTGTFGNLTAASGNTSASIEYYPSADDVGTLGTFDVRIVVKEGTADQQTFHLDTITFEE